MKLKTDSSDMLDQALHVPMSARPKYLKPVKCMLFIRKETRHL